MCRLQLLVRSGATQKKEWRDSGYGNIAELLETDSPPDAKSIIDEVRILQKDGIEAMKMAVSVLTQCKPFSVP